MSARLCSKCGVRAATGACVHCKQTFYCSAECQRDDEPIHARLCHYALGNTMSLGEIPLEFIPGDDLKERFRKALMEHRLDAVSILASEVIGNSRLHTSVAAEASYTDEKALAVSFEDQMGRSYAGELVFRVEKEYMDVFEKSSIGIWESGCKVLPYGPSPGVYTLSAPNLLTIDKDGTASPPLKRALILLLLSYWVKDMAAGGIEGALLANVPYVKKAHAVEIDGTHGLYLDLSTQWSALVELQDFLGMYNRQSERALKLAKAMHIEPVDPMTYAWVSKLFDAREGPFANLPVSGVMRKALDGIRRTVGSASAYTNQVAESMRRMLDFFPDMHSAWDTSTRDIITNLISQVVYTVWVLQTQFECTLSNLTIPNIYLTHEPKNNPPFEYKIGDALLTIPNLGFRVILMHLEQATLTVRLRRNKQSVIYSVTSPKSIGRALTEDKVPINEIQAYVSQLSPTRFDPTRDIVTFFNSMSLEPRLGIHRHPLVTHFIAHEELSHVVAFGHNKLFRRVSLDQSMVVGAVRKAKVSSLADMAAAGLLTVFKITDNVLSIASDNMRATSIIQENLANALSIIFTMVQRYRTEHAKTPAGKSISNAAFFFGEASLAVNFIGAVGVLRLYMSGLDPDKASWLSVFVNMMVTWGGIAELVINFFGANLVDWARRPFKQLKQWWAPGTIDPRSLKSNELNVDSPVADYIDQVMKFLKDSTKNKFLHSVQRALFGAFELVTSGAETKQAALLRMGQGTAQAMIAYIQAQGVYFTRNLLERHFRFMVTRDNIISGAAIPSAVTFDRYRVAVTDMKAFIAHALNPVQELKRPTSTFIGRKKKIIRDNMKLFTVKLKVLQNDMIGSNRDASNAIGKFLDGTGDVANLIPAAKIRNAAFTSPGDLVRYFGDAASIAPLSVITSELTRDDNMSFGSGSQGYVVGYEKPNGGGFVAVKMTNALSDIVSMRPTEMTAASITTAAPINEAIVSSIASQLYEDGVSPHFIAYYGCTVARVSSTDAFIGRTGHTQAELDNMTDEIVIDLLEHDNGMDMGTNITSVVSVVAMVLIEMVTALSVSSMLPTVNNMQRLLSVLQQSVEKNAAAGAVASAFQRVSTSLAAFLRPVKEGADTGDSGLAIDDDGDGDDDDDDGDDDGDDDDDADASMVDSASGVEQVSMYDQLQVARVFDVRALLGWVCTKNPVIFVTMIDGIRRTLGLVSTMIAGNYSGPSDASFSGERRPRGTAAETLKLFAAYKSKGVEALPVRIRKHVELWTETMESVLDGSDLAPAAEQRDHMFHVVSSMETIDGDFDHFPDIVAAIQDRMAADKGDSRSTRDIPALDMYVDNAMAQVVFALAQFQEHLGGMHMDFHTENVFIKICDDTLFAGRKLMDYDLWEYVVAGKRYRVPNMGFVVKIGDLGHASLSLQRRTDDKVSTVDVRQPQTTSGANYDGKNRLLVHKSTPLGIESLFGLDISPVRNLINKVAEIMPSVVPEGFNVADFANKIVSNLWLRQSGAFFPSYDLGHFMNSCAMLPFAYRSTMVLEYHSAECLRWIATYGSLAGMPIYSPNAYMPLLAKFKHPVAEKQLTTPLDMITGFTTFTKFVDTFSPAGPVKAKGKKLD